MSTCPICGRPVESDPDMKKLHMVKCTLNPVVKVISAMIPTYQPKQPLSDIIYKIFKETKKNIPTHPDNYYDDKNFPLLFETLEKAVTFILETDPHYRGYVAYFLVATMDIMNYQCERFNFKAYFKEHAHHLQGLKINHPLAKPLCFLHFLIQHPFTVQLKRG